MEKGQEKIDLFELSDDEPNLGFRVNKKFAEKYEYKKKKQELAKAVDLSELDESSESEEDDGVDPSADKQFSTILELIRNKDPAIYQKSFSVDNLVSF